jgi:hypothetical protein
MAAALADGCQVRSRYGSSPTAQALNRDRMSCSGVAARACPRCSRPQQSSQVAGRPARAGPGQRGRAVRTGAGHAAIVPGSSLPALTGRRPVPTAGRPRPQLHQRRPAQRNETEAAGARRSGPSGHQPARLSPKSARPPAAPTLTALTRRSAQRAFSLALS